MKLYNAPLKFTSRTWQFLGVGRAENRIDLSHGTTPSNYTCINSLEATEREAFQESSDRK